MYTYQNLFLSLVMASAVALGVALVSQYAFHLHPCHLCILQRWPYAAVIGLSGAGLALQWWRSKFATKRFFTGLAVLSILALFVDAGIATYHAGVEAKIFPGPDSCSNAGGAGDSLEELRRQIMDAPLVSCDQPMAAVMGLSMAGWNVLYAAASGVAGVWFLWRIRKVSYATPAG